MRSDRLVSIQALRFIAAALVVVAHGTQAISIRVYQRDDYWHFGTFGVDLFFVISGFVMASTSSLDPRGYESAKKFFRRRVVRIVPLYYFYTTLKIAIVILIPAASLKAIPELPHIIASYLFIPFPNPQGNMWPVLGVGWTLIYEFFFYIIYAAAIAITVSRFLFVASAFVLTAGASMLWRESDVLGFFAHSLVIEFLLGLLLAKAVATSSLWRLVEGRTNVGLTLLGLGVLGWLLETPLPRGISWGIPALFIVAGVMSLESSMRGSRFMQSMGRQGDASYSLYLAHTFVVPALATVLGVALKLPDAVVLLAMVFVSIVVAWVSFVVLERPMTRALSGALRARTAPASSAPL